MPHVSVLIPAYKPRYLRQAIASVLAQTFTNYELLISDDCPHDGVKSIVGEFGDSRIRLLEGPRNGLVANSAFLFDQAQCDYLKFVYDDDFLLPFAVDRLGRALEADKEASFSFCTRYFVDADGREKPQPSGIKEGPARRFGFGDIGGYMLANLTNVVGEPTSVMIRRSVVGGSECLSRYANFHVRHLIDLAFYLNALRRGPSVGIGERLAAFRNHGEQTTSLGNPAFAVGVFEWEIMLRREFAEGAMSAQATLQGLEKLEGRYSSLEARFPELGLFRRGLPGLRERIGAGDRELLDRAFLDTISAADALIRDRTAAVEATA